MEIFAIRRQPVPVDLALLLVRMVVGYAFVLHGWGKIQNPTGWMGADALFPGVFQALAAIAEFGGGFSLLLGLLTRLGALGIGCTMAVAVFMHRFVMGDPFVDSAGGGSYELASVYFAAALLLMMLGPGRFSLDGKLFGVNPKERYPYR